MFFIQVIEKLNTQYKENIETIFVDDIGGNDEKAKFEDITNRPDYSQFDTIVYVRDAEYPEKNSNGVESVTELEHYAGVIQKVKNRFQSIELTAPDKPFELADSNGRKCGYIILTENPKSYIGTLEDLCVAIAIDTDAVSDSKNAIENVNKTRKDSSGKGKLESHKHKRLFHTFLAFNKEKDAVGALTGQAVERGALDLTHSALKPIVDFIKKING
jgi:hypothetical protein